MNKEEKKVSCEECFVYKRKSIITSLVRELSECHFIENGDRELLNKINSICGELFLDFAYHIDTMEKWKDEYQFEILGEDEEHNHKEDEE